jgi:glycosyltransferase involved in cell wall biosynthesis
MAEAEMRILFICEGKTIPSTRFRVAQYVRHFEAAGHRCTLRFGYGSLYNEVAARPWGAAYKAACALRKIAALRDIGRFDLVVLQRSILPFNSLIERTLERLKIPFVFDFDDAVHLGPEGVRSKRRARTLAEVAAAATYVTAGNAHLADRAGQLHKTTVIPTAIDTSRYRPQPSNGGDVVVGWMGTASNLVFLRSILPTLLETLHREPGVRLKLVSNGRLKELEGIERVEQKQWLEAEEISDLQSFQIGLMPLFDNELARGKCGFKMIQYMSVGIPALASRVGANAAILSDSGAGVLIEPGGDWGEGLRELIGNESLRRSMGEAGRRHVIQRYDAAQIARDYLSAFEAALAVGTSPR